MLVRQRKKVQKMLHEIAGNQKQFQFFNTLP